MKNFINKKEKLNEFEINELFYYYKQGIEMGKEEMAMKIINNMQNLNFDDNEIAKIVNISPKKVKQYLN